VIFNLKPNLIPATCYKYFRKIVSEVADTVLGRKVRNRARNNSENSFRLAEKGLYEKYLRDICI